MVHANRIKYHGKGSGNVGQEYSGDLRTCFGESSPTWEPQASKDPCKTKEARAKGGEVSSGPPATSDRESSQASGGDGWKPMKSMPGQSWAGQSWNGGQREYGERSTE